MSKRDPSNVGTCCDSSSFFLCNRGAPGGGNGGAPGALALLALVGATMALQRALLSLGDAGGGGGGGIGRSRAKRQDCDNKTCEEEEGESSKVMPTIVSHLEKLRTGLEVSGEEASEEGEASSSGNEEEEEWRSCGNDNGDSIGGEGFSLPPPSSPPGDLARSIMGGEGGFGHADELPLSSSPSLPRSRRHQCSSTVIQSILISPSSPSTSSSRSPLCS